MYFEATWGTFRRPSAYFHKETAMRPLLTTRTELRWLAIAIPTVFAAHWMFATLCPRLVAIVPYSLRAVLHLL